MSELPRGPWLKLSIDFCGPIPTGEYLLVLMDEFSRYPIVHVVRNTSFETVAPLLDNIFAMFSFPETIKSDNGSPFQSSAWKSFLNDRGIKARKITPLWPQANAQAESFNKPLMKAIRAAIVERRNWKSAMIEFLRMYRCTPHATTQFTPYRLLFGRDPKTKLPQMRFNETKHSDDEAVRARDETQKQKMKEYADERRQARQENITVGDVVLLQRKKDNKTDSPRDPQPLIVSDSNHGMITAKYPNGKEVTRNKSKFKKFDSQPELLVQRKDDDMEKNDQNEQMQTNETGESSANDGNNMSENNSAKQERPKRVIRKPKRLIEEQ